MRSVGGPLHTSFTLNDIEGTYLVFIFFSVLLFTPGFVVAWLTDIFSFRSASFSERIPVAVCLSVCLSPIVLNLFAREFSVRACSTLFLLGFAAFLFVVAFEWRRRPRIFPLPRYALAGFGIACLISVVLLLSLIDLQIGSRLYPTVAVYDHGVRTAFIESAVRSGAHRRTHSFTPAVRFSAVITISGMCCVLYLLRLLAGTHAPRFMPARFGVPWP